jgi:toxin ParE1/3/4
VSSLQIEYRPAAVEDILQAHSHLSSEVSLQLADRFLISVEHTVQQISRFPHAGSPFLARRARTLGIRRWPVKEFPRYLLYYVVNGDRIDILRALHGARDTKREVHET